MKGGSDTPPVKFNRSQDHHELYLNLIRWELDDEMENVREKLQNWSKKRLIENGISLFDLIGKNLFSHKFNVFIVLVFCLIVANLIAKPCRTMMQLSH